MLEVFSPYNGHKVGQLETTSLTDLESFITMQKKLPTLSIAKRKQVLENAKGLLENQSESFARLITDEIGKPISSSRREITTTLRVITQALIALDLFENRKPIGIVGAVSPFNFPLSMLAMKVIPAIMSGCPILHKPSSKAPMTAVAFHSLMIKAGLDAEYYKLVIGHDMQLLLRMLEPDIAWFSFMGQAQMGHHLQEVSQRETIHLELGSSSPVIIGLGADLEMAAKKVADLGYQSSGQSCISVQRVLVLKELYDEFLKVLTPKVEAIAYGDPYDEKTIVGPLINEKQTTRVIASVQQAISKGASLVVGSDKPDGNIVTPILLKDVTPTMLVSSQEIFAPVVSVMKVSDLNEAKALANLTLDNIQAWIYMSDLPTAKSLANELSYEGISINNELYKRRKLDPKDSGCKMTIPI